MSTRGTKQGRVEIYEKYRNTFSSGGGKKKIANKKNLQSTTIRTIDQVKVEATTSGSSKAKHGSKSLEEIKAECLASNTLWEDPDFPADDSSLFLHDLASAEDFPQDRPYHWKRPKEICSSPEMYVGGASRMDIKQGTLGDCWLLAAISCLATNPELLHKVVPKEQSFATDYAGIFRFNFWQYGRWVEVLIDDRLPVWDDDGTLVYVSSDKTNEFWSALLEKAYAKLNGCYEALSGGLTSEALTDFTGGVVELVGLRDETPPNLFQVMLKANSRGSLMGCCVFSSEEDQESSLDNGIVIGHAYSITDVRMVDVNSEKIPMLRCRNPWGEEHEWNGAWSDRSAEWKAVSNEEKNRLGLIRRHDGEFWMSFDDFVNVYQALEICFLGPDSLTEAKEIEGKRTFEGKLFEGSWRSGVNAGGSSEHDSFWMNPQYHVSIVDPDSDDDDGTATIMVGVMQKETRKMKREGKDNLSIGYYIYEAPPTKTGTLEKTFFEEHEVSEESGFLNLREISGHHKFAPGNYVIVPSVEVPNEEGDFVLRIFTESSKQGAEELGDTTGSEDIKTSDIGPKSPNDQRIKEEGRQAFLDLVGVDGEINADQLRTILNTTFQKEIEFEGFSRDMVRSMVAMKDVDYTGKIGFEEFKKLWKDLIKCKIAFKLLDIDGSGYFNSYELKHALNLLGLRITNATFTAVAKRYSDENGHVGFDDFVTGYIRLKTMFESFKSNAPNQSEIAKFTLDEFVLLTMYS